MNTLMPQCPRCQAALHRIRAFWTLGPGVQLQPDDWFLCWTCDMTSQPGRTADGVRVDVVGGPPRMLAMLRDQS